MPLFGPIIKKLKIRFQIARLKSRDEHIRTDAAWALGQIGDPRAVEPLIAILRRGPSSARQTAAWALGQIGDPRAVEPLVSALNYGNDFVLQAAAQALGKLGHPRAVELHVGVLKDDSDGGLVREAPALELLQIGDARAVEPPHPSWPRSETKSSSSARRPPGL
jgi:HEAT repeat protein